VSEIRRIILETSSEVLNYLVGEYFVDVDEAAEITGYASKSIEKWISGEVNPQKQTVEYFLHLIFTPQFKIIVEFGDFFQNQDVRPQLRALFRGHEKSCGIYAFYDSMGSLLYVGKATNLLDEAYSAIRRDVHVDFPSGIKNKPERRHQIVRYISAYDIGISKWLDYPKHVESLILRISKPRLNKNIGNLEQAYREPQDE